MTVLPAGGPPPVTGYDVGLLDLDGVVFVGTGPVAHAAQAIRAARAAGMRVAFTTNNAARSPGEVADRLAAIGVPCVPADVVTSAQAAAWLLATRLPAGSRVLVCGTEALAEAVRAVGLHPVSGADDGPVAVVNGLDRTLDYGRLAEAALAIQRGALWVAANLDPTLPSPRGRLPGNGALVALLARATGALPLVAGKPEQAIHRAAVERLHARRPLVVGDRLDTDVAGAVNVGCDSLLVLTGVTRPADLVAAPAGQRPRYLGRDLRALLTAHPAVDTGTDRARCRGAEAVRDGAGLLAVSGDAGPDGLDRLRAACALAWSSPTAGARPAVPPPAGDLVPERADHPTPGPPGDLARGSEAGAQPDEVQRVALDP